MTEKELFIWIFLGYTVVGLFLMIGAYLDHLKMIKDRKMNNALLVGDHNEQLTQNEERKNP